MNELKDYLGNLEKSIDKSIWIDSMNKVQDSNDINLIFLLEERIIEDLIHQSILSKNPEIDLMKVLDIISFIPDSLDFSNKRTIIHGKWCISNIAPASPLNAF